LTRGESPAQIPGIASILGYGGVLPFAALALNLIADGPLPADFALKIFLYYSAAILSFLGGIRWGAATNLQTALARELTISILPGLWAVICLLMSSAQWSVWGLLCGFVVIGLADVRCPVPGMVAWMLRLRIRLTAAVALCHLAVVAVMPG